MSRRPQIVQGLTFLNRLTDEEYGGILGAAQTTFEKGDVVLMRFIDALRVNGQLNVGDEAAHAAKKLLIENKLLTQERADAVFAA